MDIKELKLKRDSIRTQIFYKDKYNEDARELVKEYIYISNELIKYGVKPSKLNYLTIEYWDEKSKTCDFISTRNNKDYLNESEKSHKKIPIQNTNINTDISKIIKEAINEAFERKTLNNIKLYEYTLNVAWTSSKEENKSLNYAINLIIKYLDEMDLKLQGIDTNDMVDKIEYIRKYEFRCTEDRFSTIKRSVQVLLDILTNDSLDIVVYGKPKNF